MTIKTFISLLSFVVIASCEHPDFYPNSPQIDTINSKQFFVGKNISDIVLAKDFQEIKPQMIPWATDPKDPYSESYIIDEKQLKITQPLKVHNTTDSARRYFYDNKNIKTTRVVFDSLQFNFNNIFFDYGYSPQNIFRNGNFILLRNEPEDWNGLANRYRFIQLFDLKQLICYEFFADYYAYLEKDSPK